MMLHSMLKSMGLNPDEMQAKAKELGDLLASFDSKLDTIINNQTIILQRLTERQDNE